MREKMAILLAEDDPVDVMSVKRAFKKNNVTNPLFVVADGEEALEFLRNEGRYADKQSFIRPSLILLDLNMPRMGGLELLEILKSDKDWRKIPVVILTTSNEESDIRKSFEIGVAGYIMKPVTFDNFSKAISIFDLYWTLSELP